MKKNNLAEAANDARRLIANEASNACRAIADATSKATTALASAALDATRTLVVDANVAAKVVTDKAEKNSIGDNPDHDLLVRLEEKIESIKTDIKDLKSGTSDRIENLEKCKVDVKESYIRVYKETVEKRIGDLETDMETNTGNIGTVQTQLKTWGGIFIVATTLVQIALHFIK